MGILRHKLPFRPIRCLRSAALSLLFAIRILAQIPTQATTVPLLLPGGLAYDSAGDLYFAETASHIVRRVSSTGVLTVVAGTGVQGFAGDGGAATAALLDSPSAVALDVNGNLYLADAHNHRIRRVSATTGVITTVAGTGIAGVSPNGTPSASAAISLPSALTLDAAGDLFFADAATHLIRRIAGGTGLLTTIAGNGTQGFSGDGGLAISAAIDSPSGIAVDAVGNVFLADTHNQRVRRVDAATGIITTVAGTGQPGFSGDLAAAAFASIDLPKGLALDSSGNLYLVDSRNQRVRQIDGITGQISTIAGNGTQAYAGDGGLATAASLNAPRAVALSPAGLPTLSDAGNARVRQVDSVADIHTVAGLGASGSTSLALTADSVLLYGTGSATATLEASPATGSITFFDAAGDAAQSMTIATIAMSGNIASDSTATLAAGAHHLSATYPGDATHAAAQSGVLALAIAPAAATATPAAVSVLYGLPIPALTGSLSGILAQDSANVAAVFATSAAQLSPAATYPITAALTGAAAGNYALTTTPAAVTIARAPVILTLPASLTVHIASTTAGVPTGNVSLLDGVASYAITTLSATGDAVFSAANLSSGTHTLTAVYAGDANFLATTSAPFVYTIGTAGTPDFTLASSGSAAVTVPSGNSATFAFAVAPVNGALSSAILLTAQGLPAGATATFNPAYLPPSASAANFTLTIQTVKAARLWTPVAPFVVAALIPLMLLRRKRRLALLGVVLFIAGCGTRVNENSAVSATRTYNITVLGTATSNTGATIQHTATVILTLQ